VSVLAEGIESITLACSLVLLIPALGIVMLGRRRSWLVPIWILSVALMSWLRFVGWWGIEASGFWHIVSGLALVGLVAVASKRDDLVSDVGATVLAGLVATWTWVPCVGRELGDILNNARDDPWAELGPTVLYTVGLFVPLILLAALGVALPEVSARAERVSVRRVGLGIIALVGGLVMVTLFDDLAGELARRSSPLA